MLVIFIVILVCVECLYFKFFIWLSILEVFVILNCLKIFVMMFFKFFFLNGNINFCFLICVGIFVLVLMKYLFGVWIVKLKFVGLFR